LFEKDYLILLLIKPLHSSNNSRYKV